MQGVDQVILVDGLILGLEEDGMINLLLLEVDLGDEEEVGVVVGKTGQMIIISKMAMRVGVVQVMLVGGQIMGLGLEVVGMINHQNKKTQVGQILQVLLKRADGLQFQKNPQKIQMLGALLQKSQRPTVLMVGEVLQQYSSQTRA